MIALKAFTTIERCRRDIIQLICKSGLREGDQLPPQSSLCARFQMGNRTLSDAMQSLVNMGLLSRRTRTGTVVADLTALERIPWSIGISSINAPDFGPHAFFALLHHQIVSRLADANCRGLTFFRGGDFHLPHQIRDFAGLAEACDRRLIDGLILQTDLNRNEWCDLVHQGIAVSHVGPFSTAVSGIVIDNAGFVKDATEVLWRIGCRHIAIADILRHDVNMVCAGDEGGRTEIFSGGSELEGGRAVAQALLQRPVGERPDAIVAADDHFAMGFTEVLKQAGDQYRPRIACITNRQLPLSYALPVMGWELDIQELADRAVSHIRGKLLGRIAPDQIHYVKPRAKQETC